MTQALRDLNEAEDIGEEKAKPAEPTYQKPTEPVIKEPASTPPTKLAQALAVAQATNKARQQRLEEARARLDESLAAAEPTRDEIADMAEHLIDVAVKSPEAQAVALDMQRLIGEMQEMERNVLAAVGVTAPAIKSLGENVVDRLAALVGANGVLSELIRDLCAEAGTVRVDYVLSKFDENGKLSIFRRFVDVGDEEPGQDPIVDLKVLVPAVLLLKKRYARLMQEHEEAVKRAAGVEVLMEQSQERFQAQAREAETLRTENAQLQSQVRNSKPDAPGTPEGYYLKTSDNLWVTEYDGGKNKALSKVLMTRWMLTRRQDRAYSFPFKADANEVLQQLQMAKLQRIGLRHRESLRVVTIRYEDQTD